MPLGRYCAAVVTDIVPLGEYRADSMALSRWGSIVPLSSLPDSEHGVKEAHYVFDEVAPADPIGVRDGGGRGGSWQATQRTIAVAASTPNALSLQSD